MSGTSGRPASNDRPMQRAADPAARTYRTAPCMHCRTPTKKQCDACFGPCCRACARQVNGHWFCSERCERSQAVVAGLQRQAVEAVAVEAEAPAEPRPRRRGRRGERRRRRRSSPRRLAALAAVAVALLIVWAALRWWTAEPEPPAASPIPYTLQINGEPVAPPGD